MTSVETICLTIVVCWLATLATVVYYIRRGRGVMVRKNIEVSV